MLFDTSYADKKITKKIDGAVGVPFSFMDRLKIGGIGSKRMVIGGMSEEYEKYLNAAHYLSYGNIELRPKGIIIHFRHKLQAYSWIMPYTTISIESEASLKICSQGKYIFFNQDLDWPFIRKLQKTFQRFNST